MCYFICASRPLTLRHPNINKTIPGGQLSRITTSGPCVSCRACWASCCRSTAAEKATATASRWPTRKRRSGHGGRGLTPAPCRPTRWFSCLWWLASGCTRLPCSSVRSVTRRARARICVRICVWYCRLLLMLMLMLLVGWFVGVDAKQLCVRSFVHTKKWTGRDGTARGWNGKGCHDEAGGQTANTSSKGSSQHHHRLLRTSVFLHTVFVSFVCVLFWPDPPLPQHPSHPVDSVFFFLLFIPPFRRT